MDTITINTSKLKIVIFKLTLQPSYGVHLLSLVIKTSKPRYRYFTMNQYIFIIDMTVVNKK